MKKLKLKNVLIGMVVFTALAAVLQLSACKQRPDKKDKGTNLEKFAIRFSVEDNAGGILKAEVDGVEINSGDKVEKGKIIIFKAEPSLESKTGFWKGAEKNPEDKNRASLLVAGETDVSVRFIEKTSVAVEPPEIGVTGASPEAGLSLPGDKELYGGVFIEGRQVKISPFVIAGYEVTYELWKEVYDWAVRPENGYTFKNAGQKGASSSYNESQHSGKEPVTKISWCDCIVWCNAYTEKTQGAEYCVYRKKDDITVILKDAGDNAVYNSVYADMDKKGFRLPTEAEWEYAARWHGVEGDSVDKTNAVKHGNFYLTKLDSASGAEKPIASKNMNFPPTGETWKSLQEELSRVAVYKKWYDGSKMADQNPVVTGTAKVGSKAPNSLGIYDMSGNVFEFCFDWEDKIKSGEETNPQGPESGAGHVIRGGAWSYSSIFCNTGYRTNVSPYAVSGFYGFRLVHK